MEEKISYSQVEESTNEMHRVAVNMSDTMNYVETVMKRLVDTEGWSGEAANYCLEKITKLNKGFQEGAYREMENCVLYLASVTEGYKALDETVVKEICNNLNIAEPTLASSAIFGGEE